jgi:hypothetical protein
VGYAYVLEYLVLTFFDTSFRHPAEPQCSYDPVEGLTLAPDIDPMERIKQLEEQICSFPFQYFTLHFIHGTSTVNLKSQLHEQQFASRSISPSRCPTSSFMNTDSISPQASASQRCSDVLGITLPHASLSMVNLATAKSRGQSGSPELYAVNNDKPGQDPFLDLLFLGWNSDLPDPATLNH